MASNNTLGGKAIFEDEAEDDEYVGSRASTPETVSLWKLYKDLKHLSFPCSESVSSWALEGRVEGH